MKGRFFVLAAVAFVCATLSQIQIVFIDLALAAPAASYLGSSACAECHSKETSEWKGSHHERAMDHASNSSVLGNFSNGTFTYAGITSSFYKKGEKFFVRTDGPDGKLTEYEIAYTFGFFPLQQYLIQFPNGRYQALSIAWDSRAKAEGGQRWFHLYPNEKVDSKDVLHWTRISQNWNYMCAECHSTDLKKNYNPESRTFDTKWSEISVGCESCHGPGSLHQAWAKDPKRLENKASNGLVYSLRSPAFEAKHDPATDKTLPAAALSKPQEINMCARCHSRRSVLTENYSYGKSLLDTHMPSWLTAGEYHDDGQIDDEVYEYGSFLQSKMYRSGVKCSDCHNPHTQKLRLPGNAVCSQCHMASKYDSPAHHFHQAGSEGAQCKNCHMPNKNYMVVDKRYDHSFRIPQPAVSKEVGSPDTCLACHKDKSGAWSQEWITKWYKSDGRTEHFGQVLNAARENRPGASQQLAALINDVIKPEIVRATALVELQQYLDQTNIESLRMALSDRSELVRTAALRGLENAPASIKVQLTVPLLSDPILGVRIEAARILAPYPPGDLPPELGAALNKASKEYVDSQLANAEAPQAQTNLGLFYGAQGKFIEAEKAFRAAIEAENQFIPAYLNLADQMRSLGNDTEGERVIDRALKVQPQNPEARLALGLLYIRRGSKKEALEQFRKAAEFGAGNPHFAYIYVVALNDAGKADEAKKVLDNALKKHPYDPELKQLAN